ncbi:MAG TPA: tripartite tricarboxylate transporter substrate binding protein [Vicinamibacterales bacterium]|nr:tripartite tricarboxylate transporter substrate binding protein [Vicinamibacterales bacterium]
MARICGTLFVIAAALVASSSSGHAAEWPTRLVRFVVPFPAGGATDVLTRLLCQRLASELNASFIVENRGGAGGNVGGAVVASSPNDGYTFVMGGPGLMSYNKALYREMRFDPDRDLDPVSLFARIPNVLVVNPSVPAQNVTELIAYAKANPNKLNYGATGVGATSFLSAELFKSMAGVDIQFVSYSGAVLSLTDLIAGRTQMVIDNLTSFLPVIRDGRVRALGISTAVRSPLIPELPTISEAGVPGYEASSWIMVAGPAGTPQSITNALGAAMKRIVDTPDFRPRMAELGAEPVAGTPAEARAFIKEEAAKWQGVITKTGVRVD